MKYPLLLILIMTFAACSEPNNDPNYKKAYKVAKLKIDKMYEGMLEFKIDSFGQYSDSSYLARDITYNILVEKEVRNTNEYVYSSNWDKILKRKMLKHEMKTDGEWKLISTKGEWVNLEE